MYDFISFVNVTFTQMFTH